MKFVFFRFRRMEKIDLVMKGLMGAMPPQNFLATTAPGYREEHTISRNY